MKHMSPANSNSPQEDPVGLCGRCRHVKRVRSDRGPVYYLYRIHDEIYLPLKGL